MESSHKKANNRMVLIDHPVVSVSPIMAMEELESFISLKMPFDCDKIAI
jgi:hypothetical protein